MIQNNFQPHLLEVPLMIQSLNLKGYFHKRNSRKTRAFQAKFKAIHLTTYQGKTYLAKTYPEQNYQVQIYQVYT